MRSRILNIRFSDELLKKIDAAAKENYQTRSQFIRQSIVIRLSDKAAPKRPSEDSQLNAIINQASRIDP